MIQASGLPPPQRTDTVTSLQPLTVTARNREELLQSVPLAVSAFSGRALELGQVGTTDRLGQIMPNVNFNHSGALSGTKSAAQFYIRGVGQRDFLPVTDPGVAVYVDGIYMPRSVGAVMDLVDVERVEVLRGPQGTLFGRNAVGGAVSVHSRRPDAEARRSIALQFGDDRMTNLTASGNGALGDGLFGSVALALRKRDGYVTRIHDDRRLDMGDDNAQAARGAIVWRPSATFEVFATADYARKRENGAPTVNGGVNDKQAFGTFGNAALPGCTAITVNPDFPGKGPPTFPPPGQGAGGTEGCYGPDSFAGEYVSEGTFPAFDSLDSWGTGAKVSWSLGGGVTLRSLTGYRGLDMRSSRDADNTPANILQIQIEVESEQLSQELQLSGLGLDDRLHWQTGLYLVRETGYYLGAVTLPTGAFDSHWDLVNSSMAGFAQATADVSAAISLTVGARYTRDWKAVTPDVYALGDASQGRGSIHGPTWPLAKGIFRAGTGHMMKPGDRIIANKEFTRDFDALTMMANLAHRLNDNTIAYVGFAEGFKSGGFDARVPSPPPGHEPNSPDAPPTDYEPETVASYEIGLKSSTGDGRLRLNLALFRADYEDLQVVIRESINPITVNGGSADLQGAELEAAWIPASGWDIAASVGVLSAEYDSLSDAVRKNSPVLPNHKLTKTPRFNHSLRIGRTFHARGLPVTPRLHWTYTSSQYHDPVNTPQLFQEGYHLLNASITVTSGDGRWEAVSGFRNLTDERYLVTGTSAFGTAAAYIEQVYGRPFEWSVSVKRVW